MESLFFTFLCVPALCCGLCGLLPLAALLFLLNSQRAAEPEKPAAPTPSSRPFQKQSTSVLPELPIDTLLVTLASARGIESRTLARQAIKRLTPETAPQALATLWDAWQTACADPGHDWRWSEAGVGLVVNAFPQAAYPLLADWVDLTATRTIDFSKVSWVVLGLTPHRKEFEPEIRDHLYYVPERLLGIQGGPPPDIEQAENDANLDALAHWAHSGDEELRDESRDTARYLVQEGRVPFSAFFSALISGWRHIHFSYRGKEGRDEFAKWLRRQLLAHTPDPETARQQIFLGMNDPDDGVRLLLAQVLAETPEFFTPADVERFLYDEYQSVSYELMQYFKKARDGAVILRALGNARTRVYAAQVICHWHDQDPGLLSQLHGLEPALRAALKAQIESSPDDWSRLSWMLRAVTPIGNTPEMLELVLPLLTYHESNTRNRASEAASAIASRLPEIYQQRVRKAVLEYYTIECADCHHRFDGWGGTYRSGQTLVCPKCKAPMIRYNLGWEWLGKNHALNHYKKRPSLMPYDAE